MKCKKCGATVPDGAFFCGECGALTSEESYERVQYNEENRKEETPVIQTQLPKKSCPACGSRINPGENFCPECGYKVGEGSVAYITEQKKNTGIIAILCAITAVLCITAVAVVFMIVRSGFVSNLVHNISDAAATAAPTETIRPLPTYAPPSSYSGNSSSGSIGAGINSSDGDYLFPSDTRYITDDDLRGKSQSEVRYILNEIYARNGYIFSDENYRRYFSSKSWYFGNTTSQPETESRFNSVELANKNFIVSYEKSRGWR